MTKAATRAPSLTTTSASAAAFLREKDPTSLFGKYGVRGELVLVTGPSACFKSILTSGHFTSMVTQGIDAITGAPLKEGRGRVLIYNSEDPHRVTSKRLLAMGAKFTNQKKHPLVRFTDSFIEDGIESEVLMTNIAALDAEWTEFRPALVIFDILRTYLGVSSNANDAVERVLTDLRKLAQKHYCCVLLVHHSAKHIRKFGDLTGGANTIFSKVRNAIAVLPDPFDKESRLIAHIKSSFEEVDGTRRFHLVNEPRFAVEFDKILVDMDAEDIIERLKKRDRAEGYIEDDED